MQGEESKETLMTSEFAYGASATFDKSLTKNINMESPVKDGHVKSG